VTTRSATTKNLRPNLARGERVVVAEPGIREWEGEVIGVKPGAVAWMVEVRNDEHLVWSLAARLVRRA
jgi:hypothetical protein